MPGAPPPPPPFPWRRLSLLYAAISSDALANQLVGPLLPGVLRDRLGLSEAEIGRLTGALLGAYSFSLFLSATVIGHASDRLGRRKGLMMFGMVVSGCALVAFGLARTLAGLFAARVVPGLLNGTQPLVRALIADSTTVHRGLAFGYMGGVFAASRAVSAGLAGFTVGVHVRGTPAARDDYVFACCLGAAIMLTVAAVVGVRFVERPVRQRLSTTADDDDDDDEDGRGGRGGGEKKRGADDDDDGGGGGVKKRGADDDDDGGEEGGGGGGGGEQKRGADDDDGEVVGGGPAKKAHEDDGEVDGGSGGRAKARGDWRDDGAAGRGTEPVGARDAADDRAALLHGGDDDDDDASDDRAALLRGDDDDDDDAEDDRAAIRGDDDDDVDDDDADAVSATSSTASSEHGADAAGGGVCAPLLAGLRIIAADHVLRRIVGAIGMCQFGNGSILFGLIALGSLRRRYRGLGFSPHVIGWLFMSFGLLAVLFQTTCYRRVVARLGLAGTFRMGAALLGTAALLLPWSAYVEGGQAATLAYLAVVLLLLAAGFMTVLPTLNAMLSNRARRQWYGLTMGASSSVAALLRALGPIVSGLIFGATVGMRFPALLFLIIAVLYFTACAASLTFPPEVEHVALDDALVIVQGVGGTDDDDDDGDGGIALHVIGGSSSSDDDDDEDRLMRRG